MAIHTRRPQDPPGTPRFMTDTPPTVPPGLPEAAVSPAVVEAAATAATAAESATDMRAVDGQPTAERASESAASRRPWLRREGWLAALLVSLIPIMAVPFAPRSAIPVLMGVAGAFILLGVVLFARRA